MFSWSAENFQSHFASIPIKGGDSRTSLDRQNTKIGVAEVAFFAVVLLIGFASADIGNNFWADKKRTKIYSYRGQRPVEIVWKGNS